MDEYKNKKIKNIKIFAYLGVFLIIVSLLLKLSNISNDINNILLIIGLIFIVGSFIKFLLFRNKKIENRYKIAETDERQIILREKSAYYAFILSIILLAVTAIVFDVLDYTQQSIYIIVILVSQYLLYLILNYYFDKKY